MMTRATSFISTTIPYVNSRPHLGHAFEYVQADTIARSRSGAGVDCYFLSGSDENSLKNVLAAEREGLGTRELVDRNVQLFESVLLALNVRTTRFIRTSVDEDHREGAAEIWRRMERRGDIYAKDYEGMYCVGCEQFYTPPELVDGKCPDHLVEPERVSERNYFFRLSRYAERLGQALESGVIRIHPQSRLNETVSFIRSGLEDISISRSRSRARGWGLPVPGDDEQVMYVWIDALTNYINALGWASGSDKFIRYWQECPERLHVLGKGVLRFHAVYWPAMLMSAELPLPTDLLVHGYITTGGQKLSKSLGNAINPVELMDRYGEDAVRYYLLAEFSPFLDGDFSEERLIGRYNTDLANGLGNLVSRATAMLVQYFEGCVPPAVAKGDLERGIDAFLVQSLADSKTAIRRFDHREALSRIWDVVRALNGYVDRRAPWRLAKQASAEPEGRAQNELATTLRVLLDSIVVIADALAPYLPTASTRILDCVPHRGTQGGDLTGLQIVKAPVLFPKLAEAR
jgi:methionyl-tRNA synthetase